MQKQGFVTARRGQGSEGVVAAALTAAVVLAFILIVRRYGPETLSHRPKQVLED